MSCSVQFFTNFIQVSLSTCPKPKNSQNFWAEGNIVSLCNLVCQYKFNEPITSLPWLRSLLHSVLLGHWQLGIETLSFGIMPSFVPPYNAASQSQHRLASLTMSRQSAYCSACDEQASMSFTVSLCEGCSFPADCSIQLLDSVFSGNWETFKISLGTLLEYYFQGQPI